MPRNVFFIKNNKSSIKPLFTLLLTFDWLFYAKPLHLFIFNHFIFIWNFFYL